MKKALLLIALFTLGCTHKSTMPIIHIRLINPQTLQITGLDAAIIGEISRDTSTAVWQSLIPVYRMPVDTDMKDYQKPQPGKYLARDSVVTFVPDTPFAREQTYFVRYYQHGADPTAMEYASGSKKIGRQTYTDLIFKQ